ncbi:hypothetical protein QQ045_026971 [Rhodiola kirilowii]
MPHRWLLLDKKTRLKPEEARSTALFPPRPPLALCSSLPPRLPLHFISPSSCPPLAALALLLVVAGVVLSGWVRMGGVRGGFGGCRWAAVSFWFRNLHIAVLPCSGRRCCCCCLVGLELAGVVPFHPGGEDKEHQQRKKRHIKTTTQERKSQKELDWIRTDGIFLSVASCRAVMLAGFVKLVLTVAVVRPPVDHVVTVSEASVHHIPKEFSQSHHRQNQIDLKSEVE